MLQATLRGLSARDPAPPAAERHGCGFTKVKKTEAVQSF